LRHSFFRGSLPAKLLAFAAGVAVGVAVILLIRKPSAEPTLGSVGYTTDFRGLSTEPLLTRPTGQPAADRLRESLPERLALPRLGAVDVRSFTDVPERYTRSGEDIPDVLHRVWTLQTNVGTFHAFLLAPGETSRAGRVCVFLHGHDGFRAVWANFRDTLLHVRDAGVPVLILATTDQGMTTGDVVAAHRLLLQDLNLMGVKVSILRAFLDQVAHSFPGAAVEVVGHSGDSMTAYYASILDPRIEGLAVDYLSDPGVLIRGPVHCESVPGLVEYLTPDRHLRLDAVRAARTHVQDYGYPDRAALMGWIMAK
jgi:hypothetical protein